MSRCKVCHNARRTKDRARAQQEDPSGYAEKQRLQWRRWHLNRYGLTLAGFDDLLARQGGRCGCCGTEEPEYRGWQVDHCHVTGRIRGILCSACNTGIGKLGDDEEGLLRALAYIRQPADGLANQTNENIRPPVSEPIQVKRTVKICATCQNPFKTPRFDQRFCSVDCTMEVMRKRRPSREELLQRVWEKPMREVGTLYNVSDITIKNWCVQLGIERPPAGHWQKQASRDARGTYKPPI